MAIAGRGFPAHSQLLQRVWQKTAVPVSSDAGTTDDTGYVLGVADSQSGAGADTGYALGIASSQLGTGSDSGSVAASTSSSESATAADTTTTLGISSSDAGTFTQTVTTQGISSSDSATGAETVTTQGISSTDAGTLANTVALQSIGSSDVAGGSESALTAVATSDSATGADSLSILLIQTSQAATGADSASATAAVSSTDVATMTGGEVSTVGISSSETGSLVEGVTTTASISSSDAAVGGDTLFQLKLLGTDSGSMAEGAVTTASISGSDPGALVETSVVSLLSSDFAAGFDSGFASNLVFSSDSWAGGAGALEAVVGVLDAEVGTGSEYRSLVASITAYDAAAAFDAVLSVALPSSDSGVLLDSSLVVAALSGVEVAAVTDSSVTLALVSSQDTATLLEGPGAIVNLIEAAENAAWSDLETLMAGIAVSEAAAFSDRGNVLLASTDFWTLHEIEHHLLGSGVETLLLVLDPVGTMATTELLFVTDPTSNMGRE